MTEAFPFHRQVLTRRIFSSPCWLRSCINVISSVYCTGSCITVFALFVSGKYHVISGYMWHGDNTTSFRQSCGYPPSFQHLKLDLQTSQWAVFLVFHKLVTADLTLNILILILQGTHDFSSRLLPADFEILGPFCGSVIFYASGFWSRCKAYSERSAQNSFGSGILEI